MDLTDESGIIDMTKDQIEDLTVEFSDVMGKSVGDARHLFGVIQQIIVIIPTQQ